MATNGKGGDNPLNGNISFNNTPEPGTGVGGYFLGKAARNSFTQDYWGSTNSEGYLANQIKELELIRKKYDEIASTTDKMTKAEKTALANKKAALDLQLKSYKEIQAIGDASDTEAINSIREGNKLRLAGMRDYVKAMQKAYDAEADHRTKASKEAKKSLDAAIEAYNQTKKQTEEMNNNLTQYTKMFNKSSQSFADSLSNTLRSAGDKLANLSNMFNLQSIANNSAEQNARSKMAIMGDVSRQFGFSSNSQFESFKNSLNSTLKNMNSEMGGVFSVDDMQQYMQNLSAYGVTDTKMAQSQMKNSMIATKYLGTSTETMEAMFKYMKRTNNNDAVEDHNKTIVGLLKSQLGVSKDQLDKLSEQTYTDAEALAALGVDETTQKKYIKESNTTKAALDSMNKGWGTSIGNIYNDIIANSYDDVVTKYGKIFGTDIGNIYSQLTSGNVIEATKTMLNSSYLRSALGNGDTATQSIIQKYLGISGVGDLASMSKYFSSGSNMQTLTNKIDEALQSIDNTDNNDVSGYVEQTQEATLLEKIQNTIDTFFNGLPWKAMVPLANVALGMYIASDAVSIFKGLGTFIGGWKSGGGLKAGLQALMGGSSGAGGTALTSAMTGMSGTLLAGGLAVGLTATAIAGLAKVTTESVKSAMNVSDDQMNYTRNKLKSEGNSMAGDNAYVKASASASNLSKRGNWGSFWGTAANVTSGWMNNFNKNDPNKYNTEIWNNFMRGSSGIFSSDELLAMEYMYTVLMNNAGTPSVAKSLFGLSKDDVKKYMKNEPNAESKLRQAFSSFDDIFIDNWGAKWPRDYDGNELKSLSLDGYHLAGKNYIPKDNYRALLHKGEMVLNAKDAAAYRQAIGAGPYGYGGESDALYKKGIRGRLVTGLPWTMTAGYGKYPTLNKQHRGLDFGISEGTKVGAAFSGVVDSMTTGYGGGYGNSVYIAGDNGVYYRYAHLSKIGVKAGQRINAGDTIGLSGNTGNSTGPHLHFQTDRPKGSRNDINPYSFVTAALFGATGDINVGDNGQTSSTGTSSSIAGMPVATRRSIPKAFRGAQEGGIGGAVEPITSSVNNGFDRLIGYLDSIREEQSAQRAIINTFAKSRIQEPSF